jgi:hypothetical protein
MIENAYRTSVNHVNDLSHKKMLLTANSFYTADDMKCVIALSSRVHAKHQAFQNAAV